VLEEVASQVISDDTGACIDAMSACFIAAQVDVELFKRDVLDDLVDVADAVVVVW